LEVLDSATEGINLSLNIFEHTNGLRVM